MSGPALARAPIHPGEYIAETLDELDMSARELGQALHVSPNRITEIIRGRRGITADTALRLGRWLGTGSEIWMNLQKTYDLRAAELENGDAIDKEVTPREGIPSVPSGTPGRS